VVNDICLSKSFFVAITLRVVLYLLTGIKGNERIKVLSNPSTLRSVTGKVYALYEIGLSISKTNGEEIWILCETALAKSLKFAKI